MRKEYFDKAQEVLKKHGTNSADFSDVDSSVYKEHLLIQLVYGIARDFPDKSSFLKRKFSGPREGNSEQAIMARIIP